MTATPNLVADGRMAEARALVGSPAYLCLEEFITQWLCGRLVDVEFDGDYADYAVFWFGDVFPRLYIPLQEVTLPNDETRRCFTTALPADSWPIPCDVKTPGHWHFGCF